MIKSSLGHELWGTTECQKAGGRDLSPDREMCYFYPQLECFLFKNQMSLLWAKLPLKHVHSNVRQWLSG